MSLVELDIPILLGPKTRSWILLIEPPETALFTAAVHPLFLARDALFSQADDSLYVSKIEKAEEKKFDQTEVLENLESLGPGSDPAPEDGEVLIADLEEHFRATLLSWKPFIT